MRLIVFVFMLAILQLGLNVSAQVSEADDYPQISRAAWFDYTNDLNYSSKVLDEYANNNISESEAIQSLMSVYLLVGRTEANIAKIEPPEKYEKYHNYTFNAVENFRIYLWNLAKFMETRYTEYGLEAQSYLNQSLEYRQKAMDELVLIL
ncbi:MAG: hypothetical protein ACYDHX_17500 [Methanothrix sp.]